ncbi:DUF3576 domain-containing protein [Paracoccus sp. S-4012]|uniref:DUF3576 domain-containing protein n=1 Tax=Paracoccus sp. S-4012 TaxID=2665648 RepID=UPI0012AF4056|nr:DUF3576 domain-containing protein [Paracoccus sp. S-4012]MRX49720.1 DUF3576 domain-containing protein [Paracoccus sp. S-4012]
MTAATTYRRRAGLGLSVLAVVAALGACSRSDGRSVFDTDRADPRRPVAQQQRQSTVWDLFSNRQDPNVTTAVNKYLWNASLEVLNFLPIQSVDPFTGVIVTGYGTPPGGGRAYRATIKIADPALDARSLQLALEGPGGAAVAPGTVQAVEDAIFTRARQLRIRDGQL